MLTALDLLIQEIERSSIYSLFIFVLLIKKFCYEINFFFQRDELVVSLDWWYVYFHSIEKSAFSTYCVCRYLMIPLRNTSSVRVCCSMRSITGAATINVIKFNYTIQFVFACARARAIDLIFYLFDNFFVHLRVQKEVLLIQLSIFLNKM